MAKALLILVVLVLGGMAFLVWKGAGVVAPQPAQNSADNPIALPDVNVPQVAHDAANKVANEAKTAADKASALLDNSVKNLKADKPIVELKPGAKAEVKITREGGALKRLKLDIRIAADSKLSASGGEFKDGETQTTLMIEAQPGITSDSAITISAGEKAKLILPVKLK
jgi:hypothetical protein